MKLFACRCGNLVHFENDRCIACEAHLGFAPERNVMLAFDAQPPDGYRSCKNGLDFQACNWLVSTKDEGEFCKACRLNEVIPDLSHPDSRVAWLKIENAKRRLVYTLLSWRLPIASKDEDAERGLGFAFLKQLEGGPAVLTGHENGLITLNIAEADDPFRESTRESMGETYRTLLGHFRHESGHYYWERLVRDDQALHAAFRDLFGDESVAYDGALKSHYGSGSHTGWEDEHVSAYAAAHPWEDWAETWAHYLHMWDTMETAQAFGLSLAPRLPSKVRDQPKLSPAKDVSSSSFDQLLAGWPALTLAINGLNRSMGLRDAYPFAPSGKVVAKLHFVHDLVARFRGLP
jgi:hypothetical protein